MSDTRSQVWLLRARTFGDGTPREGWNVHARKTDEHVGWVERAGRQWHGYVCVPGSITGRRVTRTADRCREAVVAVWTWGR